MTAIIKNNKPLRVFTFTLVTITIIGGVVTLFLKTDYAKMYQAFIKRSYKKLYNLYDSLTPEQKEKLKHYANTAVYLSKQEVMRQLVRVDGVDVAKAKKIVDAGSGVIKQVIKKVEKKVK